MRKGKATGSKGANFLLGHNGLQKLSPKSVMVLSLGFVATVIILHLISKIRVK